MILPEREGTADLYRQGERVARYDWQICGRAGPLADLLCAKSDAAAFFGMLAESVPALPLAAGSSPEADV